MSRHVQHAMHANSLEAYQTIEMSERNAKLLSVLDASIFPMTDREVMRALGWTDPNMVRPGITKLTQVGVLAEVGQIKCEITGRTVRLSTRAPKP